MYRRIVARMALVAADLLPVDDEEVGVARSRDPTPPDYDLLMNEQIDGAGVAVEKHWPVDHAAPVALLG